VVYKVLQGAELCRRLGKQTVGKGAVNDCFEMETKSAWIANRVDGTLGLGECTICLV